MAAVTSNAGGSVPAFAITRSPLDGRVTATTLGSVTTTQSYDASATTPGFGELSGLSASRSGSSLFSTTYSRDKLGRIAMRSETVQGVTRERHYTYDNGGRLTDVHDADGKPWQNGTNESFNGRFRDECLNMEWFRNRREAAALIETWRVHFNAVRPHSSLSYLTPNEFRKQCKSAQNTTTAGEVLLQ